MDSPQSQPLARISWWKRACIFGGALCAMAAIYGAQIAFAWLAKDDKEDPRLASNDLPLEPLSRGSGSVRPHELAQFAQPRLVSAPALDRSRIHGLSRLPNACGGHDPADDPRPDKRKKAALRRPFSTCDRRPLDRERSSPGGASPKGCVTESCKANYHHSPSGSFRNPIGERRIRKTRRNG
jgi:hypothetical protein